MISKTNLQALQNADQAYVWIWLPNETQPVVAGLIARQADGRLLFNYGKSYLGRNNAIPIYDPELPLVAGEIPLLHNMQLPSCIRDASPDAWGRRVILNQTLYLAKNALELDWDLDELTYLLTSGSDRVGALDFQASATEYIPRQQQNATLTELMQSAEKVQNGIPLSADLDLALQHGTSLGGARPKVMLTDQDKKYIAKFSTSQDVFNMVKVEFVAMRLAKKVGIHVAEVKLAQALGKDVLLVERFDRTLTTTGWRRHAMVSALTMMQLNEIEAPYASYEDFANIIRQRFQSPKQHLEELFSRLVFNILCGNTDDHARNHAAFWDGEYLNLTPAYDICPQGRTGGEATQAMLIYGNQRFSQLALCMEFAPQCMLRPQRAEAIIKTQISIIRDMWEQVCDEAVLGEVERTYLWGRQFLNPYALQGLNDW